MKTARPVQRGRLTFHSASRRLSSLESRCLMISTIPEIVEPNVLLSLLLLLIRAPLLLPLTEKLGEVLPRLR
jgi:hypothetical protein